MKVTTKVNTHTNNGQDGEIDRIYINQDGIEYMIEPYDKGCLKLTVFGTGNQILIQTNSVNSIIIKKN